ncbi:MAG: hypothetical protein MJZ37_02570 [Bacilli bacterium]|nr:hypothetical protein [Bacilli bacterium]
MDDEINRNTYHLMEIKISQIAARYLLCQEWLRKKEGRVSSGEKDTESHYATYVARVENSYKELDENQKLIVNNDFFYQNSYPFWWETYFSKSSYYRIKKIAMSKFLRNFMDA